MCGICGLASLDPQGDLRSARVRVGAMLKRLEHRGPDETRAEPADGAVLGATRLAIRGLHSGSQPVTDPATGVVVACNGEIDNHRELRSWLEARGHRIAQDTDIAVIPPLYLECGEAFPERLVGAFAVALWDPARRRLLLARDRAGERPLFYVVRAGEVVFASEVEALVADAAVPVVPDRAALAHYLRYGCFAAPGSPIVGLQRVPPGTLITVESSRIASRRYWRLDISRVEKTPPSLDAFDAVFRRAVERQSDVEVPYGVFLSGGVDSSLVAAVARSVRPDEPLKAFTIRFGETSYDEGDAAARVARRLGIRAAAVELRQGDFPEEITRLVATAGEPLGDPAWVPASILARRAALDVKVVLVGEGADELFGGYPTYIGARLSERYDRLPAPVKRLLSRIVDAWPVSDKKVTISFLLKRFIDGAGLDGMRRHRLWTSNIPPALLRRLGVEPPDGGPDAEPDADLLDLVQQHDLETSLAEGLLTKADRAGMGVALELRAPFLDRDVMEFAATLPPRDRVRGLTTKVFLKRYALRYLPGSVVNRRKRGLSVPLAGWLRGPLRDWARELVGSPRLLEAGVDPRGALSILDEHCAGRADRARALWTVLVLSVWLDWLAGQRRSPGGGALV